MTCDQTLDSSDAICECSPEQSSSGEASNASEESSGTSNRCDENSWPDKDHNLVCSDCKVLVNRFSSTYQTCDGYCSHLGRSCVGAWEEQDDTCSVLHDMTCEQTLDSSDAICECSPEQSSSGEASNASEESSGTSDRCDETSWPDKDHNLVCSDCKVLVSRFSSVYQTCGGYCSRIGRRCVGAWEEQDDTCSVLHDMTCDQTLDSSDAICECSPEQSSPEGVDCVGQYGQMERVVAEEGNDVGSLVRTSSADDCQRECDANA